MTELPVTVTLAPEEQADINLALRSWASDLEEQTASRKLNATRRAMRRRIEALADRLAEAQIGAIIAARPCDYDSQRAHFGAAAPYWCGTHSAWKSEHPR